MAGFFSAVCTKFNADATVIAQTPGGIRFGKAEETASKPYAVLTNTGSGLGYTTDRTHTENVGFQVAVYSDTDTALLATLNVARAHFMSVSYSLTFDEGSLLHVLKTGELVQEPEDNESEFTAILTFEALIQVTAPA